METDNLLYIHLELIHASSIGDLEKVKNLVEEKNADVNFADYDGRTPLHLSAEEGHLKIVEYLLLRGANANVVDRWYTSVIRGAMKYNNNDVVSLLQEYGSTLHCEEDDRLNKDSGLQNDRKEKAYHFFGQLDENWKEAGSVERIQFERYLEKNGLECNKRKSRYLYNLINDLCVDGDYERISFKKFEKMMLKTTNRITRAIFDQLVISDWENFSKVVKKTFKDVFKYIKTLPQDQQGANASYIPELKEFDSDNFAFTLVTVDGQVLNLGDCDIPFPIESCCKPFTYSHAIELYGYDQVHNHVGKEPSGASFNAFTLNYENKPHNACINAGAMVVCALYHNEERPGVRFNHFKKFLERMGGNVKTSFNQSVFLSEKDTAHTNIALAHYMKAKDGFPSKTISEMDESLNFYFQCCSVDVTCYSLARMASTWANGGINPHTMDKVVSHETCKRASQLMMACGMYDYSGEWSCTIGLPAKSGVGGSIYTILPGIGAFCVYSPPLDRNGNSVRGIELSKRLVEHFRWSIYDHLFDDLNKS